MIKTLTDGIISSQRWYGDTVSFLRKDDGVQIITSTNAFAYGGENARSLSFAPEWNGLLISCTKAKKIGHGQHPRDRGVADSRGP